MTNDKQKKQHYAEKKKNLLKSLKKKKKSTVANPGGFFFVRETIRLRMPGKDCWKIRTVSYLLFSIFPTLLFSKLFFIKILMGMMILVLSRMWDEWIFSRKMVRDLRIVFARKIY